MRQNPILVYALCVFGFSANAHAILDVPRDQLSDVWQARFSAQAFAPQIDTDGDGFSNLDESILGTDPRDPASRLTQEIQAPSPSSLQVAWPGLRGKRYHLESSPDLQNWIVLKTYTELNGLHRVMIPDMFNPSEALVSSRRFLRVRTEDMDSDGDGLSDWEELTVGFNPARIFSEGLGSNPSSPTTNNPRITDRERLAALLASPTSTITLAAVDPAMAENWPDPGLIAIRRTGKLDALVVNFALSGTAVSGLDYGSPPTLSVSFPFGADEAYLALTPLVDSLTEGPTPETIIVTLQPGAGYTLGSAGQLSATLQLTDASDGRPAEKAVTRFLTQATFGPTSAELDRVRDLGLAGWLDAQFARPPNLHLPLLHAWQAELNGSTSAASVNSDHRLEVWWRQTMRSDPDSDPLRQRVAFALSQIFVISDRMSSLSNDQRGMTSYQDTLLAYSFGNYRELLEAVTRHPWMGIYLSALRNRKANPTLNRFPDENYAREVMQLFSIGLWLLQPDGTLRLSDGTDRDPYGTLIPIGQPIPTYGETQIGELARVFTGLSYSRRFTSNSNLTEIATTRFNDSINIPWHPMRMWDAEHDVAAKTLWLPGTTPLVLPARSASSPDTGAAGDADLAATLDYLADHPNVAPFISRQLIQRLVTSNPSADYLARISAVFADNGSGTRGDLRAVIRAILLDPEARDPARLAEPSHGLVREPYTRFVSFARALEAAPAHASAGGRYRGFGNLDGEFLQRPLSAPSVFNFYSPDYRPPGLLGDAGLVAPELQIINTVTAILGPDRYSNALAVTNTSGLTQLNPTTQRDNVDTPDIDESQWNTRANETVWLPLTHGAPEALVQALDRALCRGTMTPATFRAVTRAISRLNDPAAAGLSASDRLSRERQRFRVAAHLVAISTEASVLK